MEFTSFFLYKGAFAFYKISTIDGNRFFAHLVSYRGRYMAPPKYVSFEIEESEISINTEHPDLLDNLKQAIEEHKQHNQLLFDANVNCNAATVIYTNYIS